MKNTHTLSNGKIFLFAGFLCAAIMTSLFVFHLSHKPAQIALSPDEGMLFPVARDIKSFKLVRADNKPFSETDFYHHWTLVFFGFTHCSSVCPTTLGMIDRAYTSSLQAAYPDLQVVLVSLDPDRDSPSALAKYTHSFNPAFIGVTGKIQELRKFQSQLGVYSERDGSATPGSAYQIQHTSSIMLIDPQGKWAGLFKFGLKPDQFTQAFVTAIKALSSAG